jgi:hypothetical protein
MTTTDQRHAQAGGAAPPASVPRLGGDELFVPASHVLVTDRQVTHPAFRLWCVLHRLWFLREPPTMDLLQELMGSFVPEKTVDQPTDARTKIWQPATRRSIERWLTELEAAGWLVWTRREETSRRYHLRTSARSATDNAVMTELRALLNSGKATLADVQALLRRIPGVGDDATPVSHDSIPGSHQDAAQAADGLNDATAGSHSAPDADDDATAESHDPILGSPDTTAESHDPIRGSYEATAVSHDPTLGSHEQRAEGVPTPQIAAPYSEIPHTEIRKDPTPPPATPAAPVDGDGGGGPTATERYLIRQGFSTRAACEFRDLDFSAVQADVARRRELGQGIGAIVTAWRVEPPQPASASYDQVPDADSRAARTKAQALAIAPPDASPLEIQYLALDLEEGESPAAALANLADRRTQDAGGGGA